MSRDPRINREQVLAAIYSERNSGRVIWTPCTTLAAMGIEWYPNRPRDNRNTMKRVLRQLSEEGLLVERPCLHSHFTFKERAYERVPSPRAEEDDA